MARRRPGRSRCRRWAAWKAGSNSATKASKTVTVSPVMALKAFGKARRRCWRRIIAGRPQGGRWTRPSQRNQGDHYREEGLIEAAVRRLQECVRVGHQSLAGLPGEIPEG